MWQGVKPLIVPGPGMTDPATLSNGMTNKAKTTMTPAQELRKYGMSETANPMETEVGNISSMNSGNSFDPSKPINPVKGLPRP